MLTMEQQFATRACIDAFTHLSPENQRKHLETLLHSYFAQQTLIRAMVLQLGDAGLPVLAPLDPAHFNPPAI